ncbi:MAG: response regulator [Pseudomonadota bacterium]
MATAAAKIDQDGFAQRSYVTEQTASAKIEAASVLIVDGHPARRQTLLDNASGLQRVVDFEETSTIAEARGQLASKKFDLLIVGEMIADGNGLDFAANLAADARFDDVPMIITGQNVTLDLAIGAVRCGAIDVIGLADLDAAALDRAIGSALSTATPAIGDSAKNSAAIEADHKALCMITQRNMRLAKSTLIPMMSFAWRAVSGAQIKAAERPALARKLARLTRNLTGLIDDTRIVATLPSDGTAPSPVDIKSLVERMAADETNDLHQSRAHIAVRTLPIIRARADLIAMLFEELLLVAVRATRLGEVPEIEIGCSLDQNDNPVIWLRESGTPLSARKQTMAQRSADLMTPPGDAQRDEFAWSLCQRLTEKLGGQFRIVDSGTTGSLVQMRFDKSMIVPDAEI